MSSLAIPLSGINDRNIQAALQAITNWAREVENTYVPRSELNVPTSQSMGSLSKTVTKIVTQQVQMSTQQVTQQLNMLNQQTTAQVVRNILQDSNPAAPIDMYSSQLFRVKDSVNSKFLFVGAGGIGGGYLDPTKHVPTVMYEGIVSTFGIGSANGSFFFGSELVPDKQITFDGATGTLTFGKNIVINATGGSASLDTVTSNASSALAGLADTISKSATTVTSSGFQMQTSGYGGGSGTAFYDGGIICKYGGANKLVFNSATGSLAVAGDISGSTGSFAGYLTTGSYVNTDGYIQASGKTTSSNAINIGGSSYYAKTSVYGYNSSGISNYFTVGVMGDAHYDSVGQGAIGVAGYANGTVGYGVVGIGTTAGVNAIANGGNALIANGSSVFYGNLNASGYTVTATTFSGALSGNASTASTASALTGAHSSGSIASGVTVGGGSIGSGNCLMYSTTATSPGGSGFSVTAPSAWITIVLASGGTSYKIPLWT